MQLSQAQASSPSTEQHLGTAERSAHGGINFLSHTTDFSFRPLQDNIRALLSTVHTVLWEGSGWTPPGMTDLVEAGKVKRQYMKVNLIIHPDKVSQGRREGSGDAP